MARTSTGVTEAVLLLAVLKRIPRKSWVTAQTLREDMLEAGYDISERRMQRMLKAMSDCEDLCIETNRKAKPYGYRQKLPDGDLAMYQMKPNESLLVRLFEEHLRWQLPQRIRSSLTGVFETARKTLNESSGRSREWMNKVAFVSGTVPMLPPKITERVFMAVSNALYRDSKLEVRYTNSQGAKTSGTVSPLGLVQQEQRLYLICKFDGYDNIRHLALHRISEAEVLDLPAERPRDFSLEKYIASRHLNFSNGRKIKLTLEFTNPATARNLSETPFARDQVLEALPDGAWRLEAVMDDTVVLDGWIAAWREIAGIRRVVKEDVETPQDAAGK